MCQEGKQKDEEEKLMSWIKRLNTSKNYVFVLRKIIGVKQKGLFLRTDSKEITC